MKTIILIFLLITCLHSYSEEETTITGAFGIKLGEKYYNPNAEKKSQTQFIIKKVEIPFRKFNSCSYAISLKGEKVYWIYAEYTAQYPGKAKDEFEILKDLLLEKYKKLKKETRSTITNGKETLELKAGNRTIRASNEKNKIIIVYRDSKIQEENRKERIEEEKKNTNTKGI